MQYKDLNLKKLRDENGLDFAHFTYPPGLCSCCYGPLDLPARYWRKGIKPQSMENVQYLLFKNADNGSGHVRKNDDIGEVEYIEWNFPLEKMDKICEELQRQVGRDYVVLIPQNINKCILIVKADREDIIEKECAEGKRRAKFVPLAPDDFANEVKAIIEKNGGDFERSRLNLDTLVHDVLKQLGYTAGVEMIEKVPQY